MSNYLPIAKSIDVKTSPWENVYQFSANMVESTKDVITSTCVKIDMPNQHFGATSTVELPQSVLLSNVILALEIDRVPNNASLPEGWGYRAIRFIEYSFGGSEWLRITGDSMKIKNISDCESGNKVKQVNKLAGELFAGVDLNPVSRVALVNLYLPCSNLSSTRYMPYDTNLLSRPVSVRIEFARIDEVMTWALADDTTIRPSLPSQYKSCFVVCKNHLLVNGPTPVRDLVGPRGNDFYTYGYVYPQYYSTVVTGSSDKNTPVVVDLKGFRAGSLQSIDLWLTRLTYDNVAGNDMYKSVNQADLGYAMSNVELLYAGNCIYRSDLNVGQLLNLTDYSNGITYDSNTYKYQQAITADPVPITATSYVLHIQLSQFNERFFSNLTQAGVDMISQNVQLRFTSPTLAELAIPGSTPSTVVGQPKFLLNANYNMQAGVRTARGQTQLIFVAPAQAI